MRLRIGTQCGDAYMDCSRCRSRPDLLQLPQIQESDGWRKLPAKMAIESPKRRFSGLGCQTAHIAPHVGAHVLASALLSNAEPHTYVCSSELLSNAEPQT